MDSGNRRVVIPRDTAWFCSMDWGFNAPGVLLWWAHIGDGHWHIFREWKFQHTTAEDVAKGWHQRNREWMIGKPMAVAADPSMWAKTGHGKGEAISETLARYNLPMVKSDNDRKNGWQRCQELLRPAPDGRPWVTIDTACTYGQRSIPAQKSDDRDADDIDTTGDDHWVDAFRYGAMSRYVSTRSNHLSKPKPPAGTYGYYKQAAEQEPTGLLARRSA